MPHTLRWNDVFPEGRMHNAGSCICAKYRRVAHAHDFAEAFWVMKGIGHHLINGTTCEIRLGDLCLIRPQRDTHKLWESTPDFTIFNVAFPAFVLRDLNKRYFNSQHFWGGNARQPAVFHQTETELQWLNAAGSELKRAPQKRLILDVFLLNLLCALGQDQPDPFRACPVWLRTACELIREPEYFVRGTSNFTILTHRSREHVARCLKKYTGKTPVQVVNASRLDYAAGQLLTTQREILDIALDCGFASLSHFYKLFRNTFGASPRHYRLEHLKASAHILFTGQKQ